MGQSKDTAPMQLRMVSWFWSAMPTRYCPNIYEDECLNNQKTFRLCA